jgi:hypothetical protein
MGGKSLEELSLRDEAGAPPPRDLIAVARRYAASMHDSTQAPKTVIAVYRCPNYLRWAVEALSEQGTGGAIEPAATCLLEAGLGTIHKFPGVEEIRRARAVVLPGGDAETMAFFNTFPNIDVLSAGTGDCTYRLHLAAPLAKRLHKLARSLGLSVSRLGLLVLMAGAVEAPSCSTPRARKAMVLALRSFRAVLERRAAEAQSWSTTPIPPRQDDLWTLRDVLKPLDDAEPGGEGSGG